MKEAQPHDLPVAHEFLRRALVDPNKPVEQALAREADKILKMDNADPQNPIAKVIARSRINTNIMALFIETPVTHPELATMYGMTRQRSFDIAKATVRSIWKHASSELQKDIPLATISLVKPLTREQGRRLSIRHGVPLDMAEKLASEGVMPSEIREKLPFHNYPYLRRRLRNLRGVEFPRFNRIDPLRQLGQKISSASDDSEIALLLSHVTAAFLVNPPLRTTVATLSEVGTEFRVRGRNKEKFITSLKQAHIPFSSVERSVLTGPQKGKRHITIIAVQHLMRAQETFRNDPTLQEFKKPPKNV